MNILLRSIVRAVAVFAATAVPAAVVLADAKADCCDNTFTWCVTFQFQSCLGGCDYGQEIHEEHKYTVGGITVSGELTPGSVSLSPMRQCFTGWRNEGYAIRFRMERECKDVVYGTVRKDMDCYNEEPLVLPAPTNCDQTHMEVTSKVTCEC